MRGLDMRQFDIIINIISTHHNTPLLQTNPPPSRREREMDLEDIKQKKIHVINELAGNTEALTGLAENRSEAEEKSAEQRDRAEKNIAQTQQIKDRLKEIESKREETSSNLESANNKYNDWLSVESEMYRAIQPFSMPALQADLDYATTESESVSETLAASFLDGKDMSVDSVNEFIKSYRKERKTYHLRRERLNRWKEERVGRP